jgi:hypothetical protein
MSRSSRFADRCRWRRSALIGLSTLWAVPATAQDATEPDLAFHGFASQGYIATSSNDYLGAKTSEGSFAFSEAALNATSRPASSLRVGIQLYARDLGSQGNHMVTVDWALGDFRWRNWLGFRVGRVKLPVGLYNTLRDVEMARPEVLQPASIYPLALRDLLAAFDGASAYGVAQLGAAGSLEYEAFVGTQDLDGVYVVERFAREGAGNAARGLRFAGIEDVSYTVTEVEANQKVLYGGALVWRTPLQGLRVGATYQHFETEIHANAVFSGTRGGLPVSFVGRSSSELGGAGTFFGVASVEYQREGLTVVAEYSRDRQLRRVGFSGIPGPPSPPLETETEAEAWYGKLAYWVGDRVQAQGYYSVLWPDRADKRGTRFAAGMEHRAWTKDLALTARIDVTSHWLFKMEWHHFDGTANLSMVENPEGVERDWSLWALKTTYSF